MVRIADELAVRSFPMVLNLIAGSMGSIALRPEEKPPRLRLLQRQLQRGMALAGLCRPGWRFSPHVTLLYRDGHPFEDPIEALGRHVDQLALVHSHVGLTRHDIVERWPLRRSSG